MNNIRGLLTTDLLVELDNAHDELREFDCHDRLTREEQEQVEFWEKYCYNVEDELARREMESL